MHRTSSILLIFFKLRNFSSKRKDLFQEQKLDVFLVVIYQKSLSRYRIQETLRSPSSEQARIVSILDKFDALTNSLTEGLPREIELRQKQYEYYRDLLLSFPKPAIQKAA